MIDPEDYTNQNKVYMKDGKLYRVLAYCQSPSVTMVPVGEMVTHGNCITFGITGTLNAEFTLVPNLNYSHEKGLEKTDE